MLTAQRFSPLAAGAVLVLLVLGGGAAVTAQPAPPLEITAFAVNLGADRPAARAGVVEINIERWSSEAERSSLLDTLRTGGSDALLSALQKTERVGYIRTPDSIGWDLHYAQARPTEDGGQRIVIATDRRIAFWELYNNTRSTEYPFTVIELRLNRDGTGEGRMSVATRVIPTKEDIELENYSAQPVLLNDVKIRKD